MNSNNLNILLTICARGGSKGIPLKNIKQLAGKPLIEYTFIVAKQFKNKYVNVDIALSTDSDDIKNVGLLSGLNVPYSRPESLATDRAGKIDAIKDILLFYENLNKIGYDYILDLDVTSPLRSLNDLSQAFQIISSNSFAYNLFSVSPANRNPYFNMVEQGEDGYYHLSKKLTGNILSRQMAPKVFDLNASFYFYRRLFFDEGFQSALTDRSLIYEVPHFCFDLDHPIDFEFLSFLILNNKIDFDWL
jgi:CMP-N-acetylneuraminic acid synthetase